MDCDRTQYSEDQYWAAQDKDIGWSHRHKIPMDRMHAKQFISYLANTKRLKGDGTDSFCDFGGNDGTAANDLRALSGGKAMCYDLAIDRQDYGRQHYPQVKFVDGPLEEIDLPDKSIDWGFSVQSLEHTRDVMKVMRELDRVLRRGCYLALPLETCRSFAINPAHIQHTTDFYQWLRWIQFRTSFLLADWAKSFNPVVEGQSKMGADGIFTCGPEVIYMLTLPDDVHYDNIHMMQWYQDMKTTHVGHCNGR